MRQNATDCTLSIFLLLFLTETGGGLTSYACSRFGKRNLQRGEEEEEEEEAAPWAIANFPHPRMVGPPPLWLAAAALQRLTPLPSILRPLAIFAKRVPGNRASREEQKRVGI